LSDPLLFTYREDQSKKPLEPGDEVRVNQVIGDFVPRIAYTEWGDLTEAAGYNTLFMMEEFLASRAITPGRFGWEGPGILLDYRYCFPFVEQLALRDGHGQLEWFWDLRSGAKYLDKDSGYIVYPPMRYADWDSSTLTMAGVSYFLGLQADKVRTDRSSRKRDKKLKQKPQPVTATQSATEPDDPPTPESVAAGGESVPATDVDPRTPDDPIQ